MKTLSFVKFTRAFIRDFADRLGLSNDDMIVKAWDVGLGCLNTPLGYHLRCESHDLTAPPKIPRDLRVELIIPGSAMLVLGMRPKLNAAEEATVAAVRNVDLSQLNAAEGDSSKTLQVKQVLRTMLRERGLVAMDYENWVGFVPVLFQATIKASPTQ